MGSEQSSLADSFDSANISIDGYNQNRRQKLYCISTKRHYSVSNDKYQQRFDDNLSTISTNISTVSLSTNGCSSRFDPKSYESFLILYVHLHAIEYSSH